MIDLPQDRSLDIGALAGLFRKVTNSYKLLFFLALLERLDRGPRLELGELGVEILALAWYPHVYFRLSFGVQDRIGKILDRLVFTLDDPGRIGTRDARDALRCAIAAQWQPIGGPGILRYVPQRLLAPFFAQDLRGLSDAQRDREIRRLATQRFDSHRPLYRFSDDGKAIEIHPDWHRYLTTHQAIVRGWALWHWTCYLQARNPNVPAIPEKLAPPLQRGTLSEQRRFWKSIVEHQPLTCLYSGQPLDPATFALDHFIPWSFVCHDRLWNLVPVVHEANAAKGNRLPEPDCFPGFVERHVLALGLGSAIFPERRWQKLIEPYIADLRLSPGQLHDRDAVWQAYDRTLQPLITLAKQIGFEGGWGCHGSLNMFPT